MGLAQHWTTQIGLRILLGTFDSCFFPSALFLVSMWYVRAEVATRNAFFYLVGNSVGGFGGVLAFGLQQMDGVAGRAGWSWIFIWEGILTIVIAITGYVLLVDFPEDARKSWRFLKDDEITTMIERVERDRGDAHVTPFHLTTYLKQGKDWKVWCFALNFGCAGLVTYAVSYFLPIILRETLGFSVAASQCLTAPCYVFSFLLGYTTRSPGSRTGIIVARTFSSLIVCCRSPASLFWALLHGRTCGTLARFSSRGARMGMLRRR